MRIGLISDTHIPDAAPTLWDGSLDALRGSDLILHGGDICVPATLDQLEAVAPVLAAQGNHDPHLADDPRVEEMHVLDLEGHTVVLVHAFDPFDWGLSRVRRELGPERHADVVVFGDTHYEHIETLDGTLIVNPGSPTFPRNLSSRLGHLGFLTLERGAPVQAEILEFSNGALDPHLKARPRFLRSDGQD